MEIKSKIMRHKWNGKILSKRIDGGVQSCVNCGMIKQYVKGFPTYYSPQTDIVYDKKAPNCKKVK